MSNKKIWIIVAIFGGTAFLVIVFIGVIGAVLIGGKVQEREKEFGAERTRLEKQINASSDVVYCITAIKEGALIKAENIAQRQLENSKIPQDAINKISQAVGHRAKYDIDSGQLLSQHDISR